MKTRSIILGSLLLAITATSTAAFAEGTSVDQSRDVFVGGTILGQWKPAASAVSNQKPSVDDSLAAFSATVLGKTPRVTDATYSKPGTELASQLFTRRFQIN